MSPIRRANLATLNLLAFLKDGEFDVEAFTAAVELLVVAQDAINRLGLPQRRDRAERPPAAPDGDRQTALTFYHGNMLVTVMQDVMTHEEKSLVRAHHVDTLDIIRRDFQETMEADFCAAVEQLTGRTVVGFVSGHRVEPDILSELFVLDTPLSTCAARLSVPRRRAGRSHWSDEWVPGPVWIGPGLARRYGASLGEAVIDRSRVRCSGCRSVVPVIVPWAVGERCPRCLEQLHVAHQRSSNPEDVLGRPFRFPAEPPGRPVRSGATSR